MLRVQVSLPWAVLRDWRLMWDAWGTLNPLNPKPGCKV